MGGFTLPTTKVQLGGPLAGTQRSAGGGGGLGGMLGGSAGRTPTLGSASAPVSGPGVGAGAGAANTGAVGPGTFVNSAAANPALQNNMNAINQRAQQLQGQENRPNAALQGAQGLAQQRYGQLQGQENQVNPLLMEQVQNLRNRMSNDTTQQATDFANQNVRQQAGAAQRSLTEDLARRGMRGDSGVAAQLGGQISADAQRQMAGNAANIGLQRQANLDQLVLGGQGIMAAPGQQQLAQQQMTNSMIPEIGGLAGQQANYQLGQQGLTNQAYGLANTAAGQLAQNQVAQQGANIQGYEAQNAAAHNQNSDQLAQLMAIANLQRGVYQPSSYGY